MPNSSKYLLFQWNFHLVWWNTSFEMLTMQTIVVFEIFIFKPEIFAIFFKIRITPSVEIGGPSNIMEVSSAYCDIFLFLTVNYNTLWSLLFRIRIPSIYAHKRKRYGDIGSPCLQTRSGVSCCDTITFWITHD